MGSFGVQDFQYLRNTSQVAGVSCIKILNNKSVSTCVDDLIYYNGEVSFSPNYSLSSHLIAFDHSKDRKVRHLFNLLNSMTSPYISKPLASGIGLGKFGGCSFLALPQFSMTLTEFIKKGKAADKKRFTEDFIQVIGNTVHGILALRHEGLDCPKLTGNHVLISFSGNTLTSKIWKVQRENAGETSSAWIGLGQLIQSAAVEEQLVTAEITDICDKLINKGLEGLQVLKQSAMLTVRQKFENIMALNLYIIVNSKDSFASILNKFPEKKKAIADLVLLMNRTDIDWCRQIPQWISNHKDHRRRLVKTGSEFVYWVRYIVEHEYLYMPVPKDTASMAIKRFGRQPDLEAQIRALMEELFLQAQNVAADLGLEY